MDNKTFYTTIEKSGTAEFRDRGSRFIGYAFPVSSVEQFKKELEQIKKEHPKATHHCFAYRIGLDGNSFRVNDDGEPSGSAGKPILGQIDSKELVNVGVIVVRYFGGTMLGVPVGSMHIKQQQVWSCKPFPLYRKRLSVPISCSLIIP